MGGGGVSMEFVSGLEIEVGIGWMHCLAGAVLRQVMMEVDWNSEECR